MLRLINSILIIAIMVLGVYFMSHSREGAGGVDHDQGTVVDKAVISNNEKVLKPQVVRVPPEVMNQAEAVMYTKLCTLLSERTELLELPDEIFFGRVAGALRVHEQVIRHFYEAAIKKDAVLYSFEQKRQESLMRKTLQYYSEQMIIPHTLASFHLHIPEYIVSMTITGTVGDFADVVLRQLYEKAYAMAEDMLREYPELRRISIELMYPLESTEHETMVVFSLPTAKKEKDQFMTGHDQKAFAHITYIHPFMASVIGYESDEVAKEVL